VRGNTRWSTTVADTAVVAPVTVKFREDSSLAMWVPAEMTE
jgi:hypothetical protein